MSWLFGLGGGGAGGGKPANPLIATSGKWLATCVALYAAIFWTPDVWSALDAGILRAVHARYARELANVLYWVLAIAAYPLMYFAVRMGLGILFVGLVVGLATKAFGGRR